VGKVASQVLLRRREMERTVVGLECQNSKCLRLSEIASHSRSVHGQPSAQSASTGLTWNLNSPAAERPPFLAFNLVQSSRSRICRLSALHLGSLICRSWPSAIYVHGITAQWDHTIRCVNASQSHVCFSARTSHLNPLCFLR
jgi:hypothetical protein